MAKKPQLVELKETLAANRNRITGIEAKTEADIVTGVARCNRCGRLRWEHVDGVEGACRIFTCYEQRLLDRCKRAQELLRQLADLNSER